MKIGIIVYSQTEHTYNVATKLREKLQSKGHDPEIEKVIPSGDVHPGSKIIKFTNQPLLESYDALIFGAPVHAFSLAPTMKAYLNEIESIQDKNIACYVTKGLPFHRTGGNKAISIMKKICISKGGNIVGTDIIVWRGGREKHIADLVENFSSYF